LRAYLIGLLPISEHCVQPRGEGVALRRGRDAQHVFGERETASSGLSLA